MAQHRRTPAALPSLSMESSSMAPNNGAKASHEFDAGARWRGLVLTTLLPMENESGAGAHYNVVTVCSQEETINRMLL